MSLHDSRETKSTYCNGRECFEVCTRYRCGKYSQVYFCKGYRSYFDPFTMNERKCPMREYYPHLREAHEQLEQDYAELVKECEALEEAIDELNQYLQIVFAELPTETADELLAEYPDLWDVMQ